MNLKKFIRQLEMILGKTKNLIVKKDVSNISKFIPYLNSDVHILTQHIINILYCCLYNWTHCTSVCVCVIQCARYTIKYA